MSPVPGPAGLTAGNSEPVRSMHDEFKQPVDMRSPEQFTWDVCSEPHPLLAQYSCTDQRLLDAIHWIAARSPADVIKERERVTTEIEGLDAELRKSGQARHWLAGADPAIQTVSADVTAHWPRP